MIALGRNGDRVVFFGTSKSDELVRFECDLDEAAAALRQLRAMLGEDVEPAMVFPPTATLVQAAPQHIPSPLLAAPASRAPAPTGLVTLATSIEDAAREAAERDAREIAARANVETTGKRIVKQTSEEELAKQGARRARVMAMSGGNVEGPVDE